MLRAHVVALVLLAACSRGPPQRPPATPAAAPAPIRDLPATLRVKQRTTTAIPGSDGRVSVTVDDVTRGQVMVSILRTPADEDAGVLMGPRSMRAAESAKFELDGATFVLEIAALETELMGDDAVKIVVRAAEAKAARLSEAEKIDRLIAAIESLEGATFLRNGDEHAAADAAEHLRRKRSAGGDDVATAESCLEHAATRSSLSGKDYEIRFADGRVVRLADFLRERLRALEAD
jgi:hypothetical protein